VPLFLYAVCELFDDGVSEHFAGDALHLGAGGVGGEAAGERKGEILALADSSYIRKADLSQSVVDGLALRVQDRCLERDIDMSLHYPRL
jgi:hypothetical protein